MVVNALYEGAERLFSENVFSQANVPMQGQMKKKRKSLLKWRNERLDGSCKSVLGVVNRTYPPAQGQTEKNVETLSRWRNKTWHRGEKSRPNANTNKDREGHVELTFKKTEMSSTTSPCTSVTSNEANNDSNSVSPEKDPDDDYSVFIVHNYVDGDITYNSKEVEASLCSFTTSGGRTLDENARQNSPLLQTATSHVPTEVRSYISMDRNKENVNNSLIDDDISAISIDKIFSSRHSEVDDFLEDDVASAATQEVGTGCVIAKQRMIENIISVKCAHHATRGCDMKLRDDDSTYVTLDADEWEREFGHHGCCFAQQMHGIVMESGDAVYDAVGEPEDYPFGEHLVSAVMQCARKARE
ncbi:hypothetical protein HJC23_000923 [Cyclotella cryptica]|uniref:Uncharacterized protein n=1 Tax=Cyclotella cryptica TaxID=29204 RepID=A0ABD3QMI8_9STRA|eukprot:CCRYP_004022-RA/>CCRYP_004022-RA protein AED:0.31 eAED:0.31 QI:0/-1/0/1/-1/1/1/0/356